jgi:hypothetical protein
VVLPKDNMGLGLTMIIGSNPVGNNHVYTGDSIQELLAPDLTQQDFEKFADRTQNPPPLNVQKK